MGWCFFFILVTLFRVLACLAEANLARLGISVYCQDSVRSQHWVRLLSLFWITSAYTIHSPIKELLPPTGIETHTVPKFDLQNSWITDAFHYTRNNIWLSNCLSKYFKQIFNSLVFPKISLLILDDIIDSVFYSYSCSP